MMTSLFTFLILVSLSIPSWQQGQQQYFFANSQSPRYINYQQPTYQAFYSQPPNRGLEYRRQEQFEPDLKTSDISVEYQQQLPQYQFHRQFTNYEQGFLPLASTLETPRKEYRQFQDQNFGHFPSQISKNYVNQQQQAVSVRPQLFIEQFPAVQQQQTIRNAVPVEASRTPSRVSPNQKEPSRTQPVRLVAKFQETEKKPEPKRTRIIAAPAKRPQQEEFQPLTEKTAGRNRFHVRTTPTLKTEVTRAVRRKLVTEKITSTTTPKLRVPFEDEVAPIKKRPALQFISKMAPSEEEEEEEEEGGEEEDVDFDDHEISTQAVEEFVDLVSRPYTTPAPKRTTEAVTSQEQLASPRNASEPTESWVIVASVQTSRSVSGARFLPSGIVNQKERNETLSSDDVAAATATADAGDKSVVTNVTSSTESIIDKLDRVGSELSGYGILTDPDSPLLEVLTVMPMPDKPITFPQTTTTTTTTTTTEEEPTFVRKFTPSSKRTTTTSKPNKKLSALIESLQFDDLTGLLPPGFRSRGTFTRKSTTTTTEPPETTTERKTTSKPKKVESTARFGGLASKIKFQDDISSFLPPDYKSKTQNSTTENNTTKTKNLQSLLSKIKFEDPSRLLPPGYNQTKTTTAKTTAKAEETTTKSATTAKGIESLFGKAKQLDINAFLPPGFVLNTTVEATTPSTTAKAVSAVTVVTSSSSSGVVFPSRPGGASRKPIGRQTEKPPPSLEPPKPKIQKGWPVRTTTIFTGYPSPPTTPISIEKLLEQAKFATSSEVASTTTTTPKSTTTTTTTTTTSRPTTPGVCSENCELAATIKIVDGVEWVPELLNKETKEWQELANEIESQLDKVYRKSELSHWYKKITIDAFNKGSVLVDYFIELSDTGRQISTREMKKLFHESLNEASTKPETEEEAEDEEEEEKTEERKQILKLGKFVVDPKYTDFIVLPKRIFPTVGYAEEENFLPQWAIAVIVIGLASLLFVIIFGVTVLVNRHKNNKKKNPTPLTEDIINEMNKHHLGGFDNYGADDLYGMDDVWNDRGYDKPPKKRSHGSYADNSMTNLYDSWRSDWNGYYYNSYYGNGSGGSGYGGGRRRSDYDTNF